MGLRFLFRGWGYFDINIPNLDLGLKAYDGDVAAFKLLGLQKKKKKTNKFDTGLDCG